MTLKVIVNIIGWIILLVCFGALGFSTDNPAIGVPIYTVFFALVFGLVFLYVRKHKRHEKTNQTTINLIHKIFGLILLLLAVFSPVIALRKIELPFIYNLIMFFSTAVIIGLGTLAVTMLNNTRSNSFLSRLAGFLLLIILAAIPALIATQFLITYFPSAYNALGTAYWAIVSVAVFSWWGFSLFFNKAD